MSKIIGVTVGTPTSPSAMEEKMKPVKSVNGILPDESGNVEIDVSGVYVGAGEMPEGYNVQIDPDGSATDIIDLVIANLPMYRGEAESL